MYFLNVSIFITPLDSSWAWAISEFAKNGKFIFGRDIAFTYGPLGYLIIDTHWLPDIYERALFNIFAAALLFFQLYFLIKNSIKEKHLTQNDLVLFAILALPFLGGLRIEWFCNITLFLNFLFIWQFKNNSKIFIASSIAAAILSASSLFFKFNMAALAGATALTLSLIFLVFDRKNLIKYILPFGFSYLLTIFFIIQIFFKKPSYFLKWLKITVEMASSYNAAMVYNSSAYLLITAIILIVAYLAIMFQCLKLIKNGNSADNFIKLLLFSPMIFFSYKHAFVSNYITPFFTVFPISAALLFIFTDKEFRLRYRQVLKICFAICLICLVSKDELDGIFKNFFYNSKGLFKITQIIKDPVPETYLQNFAVHEKFNNAIGTSSIQILPVTLLYAAANHWTGWQPNPVLQLYMAFSKKLDEESATSFSREQAPDFIFLEFGSINNRNMLLDTPATWNAILPNYTALLKNKKHLLLQKKPEYKNIVLTNIKTEVYKFEEAINIPETKGLIFAKIKITTTLLGKILTALFRGNPSDITIKYENGEKASFRVISDTLQNPVLISYIPYTFEQFIDLFSNNNAYNSLVPVKKIVFRNKLRRLYYKNNIEIEWFEAKEL